MIQRQQKHQRTQAKTSTALGDGRQENGRRGSEAERRSVMLGYMVRLEAAFLIGFDEMQAVLEVLR